MGDIEKNEVNFFEMNCDKTRRLMEEIYN